MSVSDVELEKMKFFYSLCKKCQHYVAERIARGKSVDSEALCEQDRAKCVERLKGVR